MTPLVNPEDLPLPLDPGDFPRPLELSPGCLVAALPLPMAGALAPDGPGFL